MKNTIFYSWQSDLPRKSNWSFIEDVINSSIKNLKKRTPIPIILNYDRATRDESGSPDITESIFAKISSCNVFVADISIINNSIFSKSKRKTPNPNVLLELGFAARTIGWEKIICLYNTDYGNFDQLPFDLRNRRVMTYSLKKQDKSSVKKSLSKQIYSAIEEMHEKGILTDKILDFLKKEIDQEILTLVSHFTNFIYKRGESSDFFTNFGKFTNLSKEGIYEILHDRKVLGFYLFKSYHEYEKKFHNFILQALSSSYYNREIVHALIDIYSWFATYQKMYANTFQKLLVQQNIPFDDNIEVIHSSEIAHGDEYPDRYFLVKKENRRNVLNFGDFYPGNIPFLVQVFSFDKNHLEKYADAIYQLIESINQWTLVTNNEMIIDFVRQFRVETNDGELL